MDTTLSGFTLTGTAEADPPPPLPPRIALSDPLMAALRGTELQFARLEGALSVLSSHEGLLRILAFREAIASMRCDGASLDLASCLDWSDNHPTPPIALARHYAKQLIRPVGSSSDQPFGISLIKDIYRALTPENTTSTHDSVFKPVDTSIIAMGALETYLNSPSSAFPPLVDMALLAYQFEAISPLPEKNGLVGRILLPLLLRWSGVLKHPALLLCEELHMKRYELTDRFRFVQSQGDYQQWISFIVESTGQAIARTQEFLQTFVQRQEQQKRLLREKHVASALAFPMLSFLVEHPVFSISQLANYYDTSFQRVSVLVEQFLQIGIIAEATGKKRGKRYIYPALIT